MSLILQYNFVLQIYSSDGSVMDVRDILLGKLVCLLFVDENNIDIIDYLEEKRKELCDNMNYVLVSCHKSTINFNKLLKKVPKQWYYIPRRSKETSILIDGLCINKCPALEVFDRNVRVKNMEFKRCEFY